MNEPGRVDGGAIVRVFSVVDIGDMIVCFVLHLVVVEKYHRKIIMYVTVILTTKINKLRTFARRQVMIILRLIYF